MKDSGIFFDLDGTLMDTAPSLIAALDKLLSLYKKEAAIYSDLAPLVSNGANALLKASFSEAEDPSVLKKLRLEFLDLYLEDVASGTQLYPGIEELLQEIAKKQLPWGIVTNKPWVYTEALLKHFTFPSELNAIICPEHVSERKPAAEALELACKHAKTRAEKSIYIGDHKRDIDCAKNAGALSIAVSYGYIPKNEDPASWQADYLCEEAHEIWPIIQRVLKL